MAQIDQNTYTQVENPGAYFPQDYSLESLNFLTGSGQRFDIKKVFVELSYYEDIYSFAVSGYATIVDAQGFIELLQLTGNEFIEISFSKTKNAPNINKQVYRVYKISDRKPVGNMNSESYTLYFCSEELLLSEQTKISKSYKGKKISDVIKNIMTEKLAVDPIKLNIEETTGVNDFIVPQFKPFEAISWLSTYARPNKSGIKGADMLFFETKDKFNFRSLQSMFLDEIYTTYKYQQKNIDAKIQSFQEETISVLEYEFTKVYDMMNDTSSGTFANRLISIDPMARTSKITDFNYEKYKAQAKTLNPNDPANIMRNRLGLTKNNSYDASFKVATGNAFQQDEPYIKQAVNGGVAKNIAIETYVPNRTAQISLANYTVLKIKIPGDTGITAGRTINFNLLTLKPTAEKKNLDEMYSGKYLVTAVRHIIQPTVFQTVLEIAKDSTPSKYASVDNNSAAWENIVKL
jgi:hypothetical protein